MDRVGLFEPTTSAILAIFYLRAAMERELTAQIPPAPIEILLLLSSTLSKEFI
jgi:hypothetical protein